MTLLEKQFIFAENVPKLINFIFAQGYTCSLGEALRTNEQAWINAQPKNTLLATVDKKGNPIKIYPALVGGTGIAKSVHMLKLAIDLNLFKDSAYITDSESHKIFGEFWKSLHPDFRWGGDWGDGNHYSMEHEGVK